jgi:hypothetical protein
VVLPKSQAFRSPIQRFEAPKGWASVAGADGVVILTMNGHLDAAIAKQIANALHSHLVVATEPVQTFWDLEHLEQYHSDVRVLCTHTLVRNWPRVAGLQTLATNRIVKMGVAVANVALRGRVHNTESRAEFDEALRAALSK